MFCVFTLTWHFSFTCNGHLHFLDLFVFLSCLSVCFGFVALLFCLVCFFLALLFRYGLLCCGLVWMFGCWCVWLVGCLDAGLFGFLAVWWFFVCLFCLFVCVSVCRCLSVCFWFWMSLYMGLSNLGGPKSILENSVAKRDLNSTDGLETTRIFEIGHLSSLLRPTFLLFINLPENVFFTNKFYSPTTDLPEVLSYILGFAMYDLPESSCRIFLEKPDGAILPQPIGRKCCKLQWKWQFTTFLTSLTSGQKP